MNKEVAEIKKAILKKQLKSFESINKLVDEFKSVAKDGTIQETLKVLNKLDKKLSNFRLPDNKDLINFFQNSQIFNNKDDFKTIIKTLEKISSKEPEIKIKDVIKWPSKPKEAIPVVLTDKFKEEFYDALKSLPVYFGGGGGNTDTSKLATSKLQQDIIDAINDIEINADQINLNTDDLEEKLDTIISENKDGSQVTKIKETLGTDDTKNNSSGNITPVTVGNVTTITVSRIIKGTTETKTDTFNTLTGVFTWGEWA